MTLKISLVNAGESFSRSQLASSSKIYPLLSTTAVSIIRTAWVTSRTVQISGLLLKRIAQCFRDSASKSANLELVCDRSRVKMLEGLFMLLMLSVVMALAYG